MAKTSSASPPSAQFSAQRERVFEERDLARYTLNGKRWVNFYALLEIELELPQAQLEEAIINCGADLLLSDFGRSGTERAVLVRRYIHDFRPVLLEAARRARYDAQLKRHLAHDATAPDYESWRRSELDATLGQRLKRSSQNWLARVRHNLSETPYR